MMTMLNLAITAKIVFYSYYLMIDYQILQKHEPVRILLGFLCDATFELTMFINLCNWSYYYFKIRWSCIRLEKR